ncbi:MAG: polyprenyl synthetase family protein [Candidatus Omnitrophica bacterium]|nr:polyprenyl synthetase family protein [Candidatus Omnitrophota bacterium]MCM8793318.1 polyprenyl synthetase family protein [Candidatus Omnitrophota bacterium]
MERYWREKEKLVNQALRDYLRKENRTNRELLKWMRYSSLAGGKRIRALLVLATVEMLGKNPKNFLPCACGIEMIHTSSLILDDLPCMDDAILRRGKPALHRVSGEAKAILSAYALCAEGIRLISENAYDLKVSPYALYRILKSISLTIGIEGISLGQFLDLKYSGMKCSRKDIEKIHFYKTASLFISVLEIAGILTGAKEKELKALKNYGKNLGLAFQIRDDFREGKGKIKKEGKYSLKDGQRPNYRVLLGKEDAEKAFLRYKKRALFSLKPFGERAKRLQEIVSLLEL